MTFEEILKNISPRLKAIAFKLGRRFTFIDSDDLYQEAVIHLWEKFNKNELADKTESYVLQGCYFFLKNYLRVTASRVDYRSMSLQEALFSENKETGEPLMEAISVDPAGNFSFILVDIMVEDILKCLTDREREIFELSLEDLTTREMGRKIGISHVMVVKIVKRIREKCRCFAAELLRGHNHGDRSFGWHV